MAIDDNTSYELTGYQVKDLASKIRAKADSNSLASVATSGLYSDLTGAPTIPTVYNGTLTIQQNGTTLGTFSANQSANETINITAGGGSAVTTFYTDNLDSPTALYKDALLTTTATFQEIYDACSDGLVKVNDAYTGTTSDIISYNNSDHVLGIYDPTSIKTRYLAYASASATAPYPVAFELQKKLTAGSNITISSNTISATDTTYSDFTGATTQQSGTAGLVPAPTTSDPDKFLKGDGTWGTPPNTTYTAGSNINIDANNEISATDTTYSNFTGATASVAGAHGLVPAPAAGDNTKVLTGDGTWKLPGLTILKYGTSTYNEALAAYQANNLLYCRASSNSNPGTGDQLRMAFLAYVNAEGTPTEFEFQYYRSVSTKTVTNQGDETFVYKLNKNTGWSVTKRNNYTRITTDSSLTDSFSSGVLTLSANAMTGATSGAAGTAGYVPAPAAGDEGKVLKGDGTWEELDKLSFVIDGNVDSSQFFGGTYSQTFTVETSGNYLILDSFSSVMGRAYNASNNLTVKIDGTQVLKYRYDSVTSDQDWGTNRRTITGTQNIVALSAGSHTITTTGNLYLYDAVGSHTITAIKLADAAAQAADSTTLDRITVRKTSDSSSVGQGTITMDSVDAQVGTKLTLDSGGVKVGAGITKVLVSGNVFYNTASGKAYGWVSIRKNGVDTGYETIASITNGSYGSAVFAPIILSVSENDVITFYNKETGSNIRGGHATYMTVQVVA